MKIPMLALTVLAVSAWAQPPAPSATELKSYLSLSDAQVTSLQTLQQNLHTSIAATMQQIQTKQRALDTQLAAGNTSAAIVGQELLDIQGLRKSVTTAQTASQSQALNVLTADQKTKLKALTDASALRPQVQEGLALGLIVPPADAQGGGPGMPGGRGPAGFGGAPAMGTMMRGRRGGQ
ncbi:MAG: hypothetical protein JWP63_3823 [Candidatus Solibacter sp.]|jgi:Spy/CpxP family protein refolding chaperone|nr:hypothetical protein [Candidatus Solibacter sp.]